MVAEKSMCILQLTDVRRSEMIEIPIPEPRGAEVLAKVLGVVTCNSYDIHIFQGRPMLDPTEPVAYPQPPGFPGHEWVAEVVEVGPEATQLQVGDWMYQPGGRGTGRMEPRGAYTQYLVIDESRVVKVPKGMDLRKLAPLQMASDVSTNILELKALNVIEGKMAGVSGLGPAGLMAAQFLRAEGAEEVIGIEISQPRREHALSSGVVDRVIDPLSEEGLALPMRRGAKSGGPAVIDVAVDCAGSRASAQYLMDHTQDIVSFFAVQREPYSFEGWYVGQHHGLKIFGCPDRHEGCGLYAARHARNGSIDLSLTVSHTMGLEEYDKALELIESHQALKVMFVPHGPA